MRLRSILADQAGTITAVFTQSNPVHDQFCALKPEATRVNQTLSAKSSALAKAT